MRKFLMLTMFLSLISWGIRAQNSKSVSFASPLTIPLFLSGNYGELRSGHFHAGLDLKTMGEVGKVVLTAESGYVSRIKVQTGGYGKALYVTHPNGYTTVYGHLDQFMPELQEYLLDNQYTKHCYEVDLFPPKDMFVVKKGEQIAWSGNSGSSGGPHLHFEIRRTSDEVPVNGLKFNFPIADHQSPEFRNLVVYNMSQINSTGGNGENRKLYLSNKVNDTLFTISGIIECTNDFAGFGAEVYDYLDGSVNKCGIYEMHLYIDNQQEFSFKVDGISFSLSRFINAHMDYDLKKNESKNIHRLYLFPNNQLPLYSGYSENKGVVDINDDSIHSGLIIIADAYGNKSRLAFKFKAKEQQKNLMNAAVSENFVKWDENRTFEKNGISVFIPSGALYRDIYFNYTFPDSMTFNSVISLNTSTEPLQKNITLQVKLPEYFENYSQKLVFAKLDETGRKLSMGGEWHDGYFTLFTRDFGNYVIDIDTIAPNIAALDFKKGNTYSVGQKMTFRLADSLSGIKEYNAYVNKKWVLLEYDPKSEMVSYTIDPKFLKKQGLQNFKIYVTDQRDNVGVFESNFIF